MWGGISAETLAPAAVWAIVTAGAGAMVTELGPWYRELRKPAWQPPDWLFGPAWTVIFLLAALAAAISLSNEHATGGSQLRIAIAYVVNAALNIGWSVLFFRWHRPDWALVEVAPLWLSIVGMMAAVAPLSRVAVGLLVPYLLWVTFAAVLNRAIVGLNGPFPGR